MAGLLKIFKKGQPADQASSSAASQSTAKDDSKTKQKGKVTEESAKKAPMKDLYKDSSPKKDGKKQEVKIDAAAHKILIKPLVTEKATNLGALNKYAFAVSARANKIEIAKAMQQVYGITPLGINIVNLRGKKARYGRIAGRRKDWKKAIITLPAGSNINIYEGV